MKIRKFDEGRPAPPNSREAWLAEVLRLVPHAVETTPVRRDAGASVVVRLGGVEVEAEWRVDDPREVALVLQRGVLEPKDHPALGPFHVEYQHFEAFKVRTSQLTAWTWYRRGWDARR